MKAKAYTTEGKKRGHGVELPAGLFDGTVSEAALHQVVTAIRARGRQGTASTKTRNTVSGGGAKPWRQKGTGRARAGSNRSPLWRGGAVTFGPQPRSFAGRVPKKLRGLAIRSALNARALEDALVVVEPFALETPKTKAVVSFLAELDAAPGNVLFLTNGLNRGLYLSARNIPSVLVRPWGEASAYDILWSDLVVVEETALGNGDEVTNTEEAS
ncbi:MAG: 50S ribosomal protein L4 [Gemmatimonadota bacterium]